MPFISLEERVRMEDYEAMKKARKIEKLSKTNLIARQHGIKEPDMPEAIKYDNTHCISCGDELHNPDAYKDSDIDYLKVMEKMNQKKINTLCCSCFGTMQRNGNVIQNIKEPDSDTFKRVYDPLNAPKYSGKVSEPKTKAKTNLKKSDDVSQELSMDSMFFGAYSTRYG